VFSPETRRQAAAFDAIGERYDDVFPHKSGQIIATQWMIDRLATGARVLDLGCGTGVPTAGMFAESGIEVVGIDVSTEMLALARRNVPTGRFVAMDAMELDDTLGRFDAACAFFSLLMLRRIRHPEGAAPDPVGARARRAGPPSAWSRATWTTRRCRSWARRCR
jgi:Methylase involved in ubiquinone/menaquinone biosynthesis